jgi:hypothetical protein
MCLRIVGLWSIWRFGSAVTPAAHEFLFQPHQVAQDGADGVQALTQASALEHKPMVGQFLTKTRASFACKLTQEEGFHGNISQSPDMERASGSSDCCIGPDRNGKSDVPDRA